MELIKDLVKDLSPQQKLFGAVLLTLIAAFGAMAVPGVNAWSHQQEIFQKRTEVATTATAEVWHIILTETQRAEETRRAPTNTVSPTVTVTATVATVTRTPLPGPVTPLHEQDRSSVPTCPTGRAAQPSELPCWYIIRDSTTSEEVAAEVYRTDISRGATNIANQNRSELGNYLSLFLGNLSAAYVPSRVGGASPPYPKCITDLRYSQYPCLYTVLEGESSYSGIAARVYGDSMMAGDILLANQYYNSGKDNWYKVELDKDVRLVVPSPR